MERKRNKEIQIFRKERKVYVQSNIGYFNSLYPEIHNGPINWPEGIAFNFHRKDRIHDYK